MLILTVSGCTSNGNGKLDTTNLEVEEDETYTVYEPVEKKIAEESLPYEINYPSYFPFKTDETKTSITDWKNNKEKIVTTIIYPSIEEDAKWEEDSLVQKPIPNVRYTVANFDRYYSEYSYMDDYKKVDLRQDKTGLFKENKEMDGAELIWFNDEMEYSLELTYFSDESEELKSELIKVANSI